MSLIGDSNLSCVSEKFVVVLDLLALGLHVGLFKSPLSVPNILRLHLHLKTPAQRRERKKWTPADDEVLISAWLNTSKDAIVGNDQKSGTFWNRVQEYYASSPHVIAGGLKTKHNHCKQRWHKLNDWTNKFCGVFAAAERRMTSGQSENDVLKLAHKIYYELHNQKLNLPKTTSSSKRKTCEPVSQNSSTNFGDVGDVGEVPYVEMRPEGVKAAKARRAGKGKTIEDYKTMCELKMINLEKKEKLSKLGILDTLLAKKEPLSEAEEVNFYVNGREYHLAYYLTDGIYPK
ncbi:glutathione S-transferase T2-like [Raphanus sativus]|uniref:Glutathione S-transferase T2-like n=1 Tax=Raphanus sativus TaxID=3726 RepID=A0A9W3D9Y9_RAPSA|nr:glutathione S-transferase T2-like [Raphanus sativus]